MQASQFDFSFYDYYSATNSNINTDTDTDTASQAYPYQPNGSTNPHASAIPLGAYLFPYSFGAFTQPFCQVTVVISTPFKLKPKLMLTRNTLLPMSIKMSIRVSV